MSRFHSYISSASKIIDTYDGIKPFVFHLKSFFAAEKKYGSRDRKMISSLCYHYFRIGHALKNTTTEERILAGLFLAENKSNGILALLRPDWNEQVSLEVSDKMTLLNTGPESVFPFSEQLGDGINKEKFAISFFQQPDLYLRIRPGKSKVVIDKLSSASILYEKISEDCLKLANTTALDTVLKINKEVVIQDQNSQHVLDFLKGDPLHFSGKDKITVWDCCAASGGKSILLYDILNGKPEITVSDIRENILLNLEKRLQQAGINIYKKFTADLSKHSPLAAQDLFTIILCDAPCTGSGTWGRTPEQLYYFNGNTILMYAERQKNILSNIVTHLQPGGLLFYITCSVFKEENEDVVTFIKEKYQLPVLRMEYLKGYEIKADTMFVAVFSK